MRLDFAGERVLCVTAHPDDAELLCAGTLARATADGAAVGICVMCQGDKGGASGEEAIRLAEIRQQETTAAAALLAAELFLGGIGDGQAADTAEQRLTLMTIYRRFRPTLVLAHNQADYHADHRACFALAEAASWFACSAGYKSAEPPLLKPPAMWLMDSLNMLGFSPGFFIDISDYLPLKQNMLACHKSQLHRAANDDFEPLDQLMLRQAAGRGAQAGVAAAEAFRIHSTWKRVAAW